MGTASWTWAQIQELRRLRQHPVRPVAGWPLLARPSLPSVHGSLLAQQGRSRLSMQSHQRSAVPWPWYVAVQVIPVLLLLLLLLLSLLLLLLTLLLSCWWCMVAVVVVRLCVWWWCR